MDFRISPVGLLFNAELGTTFKNKANGKIQDEDFEQSLSSKFFLQRLLYRLQQL